LCRPPGRPRRRRADLTPVILHIPITLTILTTRRIHHIRHTRKRGTNDRFQQRFG
jgi:hypothetical protein